MLVFKSRKYLPALVLVLVLGLVVAPPWSATPRARAASKPLIGAIRWDAWFPDVTTFPGYVNPSILTQYNFRVPFYGWDEVSPSYHQAIMDQEIRYAVSNHLDYWAFDWYPEGLGYTQGNLSRAFDDYMASSLKFEMKFTFVIQSYWAYTGNSNLANHWRSTFVPYFVKMFQDPQYVKVNGNHPLVYWFGATSMPTSELQYLTAQTEGAGLGAPFYVAMEGAGAAESAGMQGQTFYDLGLGSTPQCYSAQASADDSLDGAGASNGIATAPFLEAVNDPRPRPDEDPHGVFTDQPTYSQWQRHLQDQYNWAINNSAETSDPAALLIYAWDEIDEGGPGIVPTSQEGLKYLAAINAVQTASYPAFNYDVFNDDNCNITYAGSWTQNSPINGTQVIGNYNNDEHVSSTANDSMQLTWSGTGFDVVGIKGPDRGQMQVLIDNQSQGTIDLYNATRLQQQVLFSRLNLPEGSHMLKIVVTGQKNPSSSGTTVGIDAIRVKMVNSGSSATPPPAPTGVQASVTPGTVSLNWVPTSDATSYTVKRSTDGINFTTLSANQAGTSYTDTSVSDETLYYYVVDANNANGTSADSVVAMAQPSTVVKQWKFDMENDPEWSDAYEVSGTTANGTFNLTASGNDPQIISDDNLGIDLTNVKCISVRMKNQTSDTTGEFYFTTTSSPNFDATKHYSFPTVPNSDYTVYNVDTTTNSSWTGTLKQLRFDPIQTTGVSNVDFIKLETAPCSQPSTTAFVTGVPGKGQLRNDYSGYVGMKITTGSSPLTITDLGRYFVPGNTGQHTLKIVRVSDHADIATVTLNMNVGTPDAAGILYAPLPAPVTLAPNTAYYIVSSETSGGDQWYDNVSTMVGTTSVASVNGSVYTSGSSWVENGSAGNSYGPVSFRYATATSFVTGVSTGSQLRNDFGNYVGMQITTLNTGLTIKSLGRYYVPGNSGTHTLEIVRASDGSVLGSATVNMAAGQPDALGFKYALLGTPITLAANTTYYIVSSETSGGDQWYGNTSLPSLNTTGVVTLNSGIYFNNASWHAYGSSGNCYVPLNFTY